MGDVFKKSIKMAAVWFVAGALFALAANFSAPLLGTNEIATLAREVNSLWVGSLMGGATFIAVAAESAFDFIFGKDMPKKLAPPTGTLSEAKQININIQQAPQQTQGQAMLDVKHQQDLKAERLVAILTSDQTPRF